MCNLLSVAVGIIIASSNFCDKSISSIYYSEKNVKFIKAKQLCENRSGYPDTIYYYDGIPWNYSGSFFENLAVGVRFTAPTTFVLKSIIFYYYNWVGVDVSCTLDVRDTINGNILSGPIILSIPPNDPGEFWIIQVDIDSTDWDTFAQGEDFWIFAYNNFSREWYGFISDHQNDYHRSFYHWRFIFQNEWSEDYGDLFIAVAGTLESYVDLKSTCTYNDLGIFLVDSGQIVFPMASITNRSNTTFSGGTILFQILDSLGNEVLSITDLLPEISPHNTIPVVSSTGWIATPGHYAIKSTLLIPDDIDSINDWSDCDLVVYRIGDENSWLRYHNFALSYCPCNNFNVGDYRHATEFRPQSYPLLFDSLEIAICVCNGVFAYNVPVEIWWGMAGPESLVTTVILDTVAEIMYHRVPILDTLGNPTNWN
jgi:hypothetical protein